MSINSAMLSGVSGLIANSSAMGAISDNIANANTVGYKRNVTDFQDLVTATASVGAYNSGGVLASTRQLVSQQGQLSQSTSATDLAIDGDGFFVVTDKATGLTSADTRSFTRAGSFTKDDAGYLKNTDGEYLQGWLADASGNVTTDPSDLSKLSTINIGDIGTIPNPTTKASLNMNLDASTTASSQEATYNAATPATSMAAYSPTSGAGVKPDYSTQITVYDAQGGAHTMEMDFLKSATANQWHAELRAIPATDVAGTTNGLVSSGIVAFNPDGTLDTANTTFSAATTTIGASTDTTGVRWGSTLGLPSQAVNFNLSGTPASVTQYVGASTTTNTVDGGPAGTVTGVTVAKDGTVSAAFSNGAVRTVAKVAIATFQNPDGLQSVSGDNYRASVASGGFTLRAPGEAGSGDIAASNLESSTVDLSSEFTGLIITQRAYSACSKIITTADQMLQELINTKQ